MLVIMFKFAYLFHSPRSLSYSDEYLDLLLNSGIYLEALVSFSKKNYIIQKNHKNKAYYTFDESNIYLCFQEMKSLKITLAIADTSTGLRVRLGNFLLLQRLKDLSVENKLNFFYFPNFSFIRQKIRRKTNISIIMGKKLRNHTNNPFCPENLQNKEKKRKIQHLEIFRKKISNHIKNSIEKNNGKTKYNTLSSAGCRDLMAQSQKMNYNEQNTSCLIGIK